MWTCLIGPILILWLPALSYGLPSDRGSPEPTTSSKPETSNMKVTLAPKKYLDSGAIAQGDDVEALNSNKTSAPTKTFRSSHFINKCCPYGEYLIKDKTCVPLPVAGNISDPWSWIAPSQRQNLLLDSLTERQVIYEWTPCKSMWKVFFDKDSVMLHHRKDGVRLESPVDNKDVESTHEFTQDSFCLDVGPSGRHFAILCPCTELICLRKCCNFTDEFDPMLMKCTRAADDHDEWVPAFHDDWKIDQKHLTVKGYPRCAKNEKPFPVHDMHSSLDLVLMGNGSIKSNVTGAIYQRDSFCADFTPSGNETLLICIASATRQELAMSLAMGVLLAIGSLALLLTVCISLALPETRKRLHGRMALMHNTILLVAYVSTGALHLIALWYSMSVAASKVISFVIQFSFLSAFFWLNVMCIDIAMVFRGWRLVQGTAIQQEEKKFFYYSVYAWGSVSLISVATAIAEFVPGARPRPAFGERGYFFNNDVAMLLFFYGPMAVLLAANLILFIFTAIKIKMAAQESSAVLNCADSKTTRKNKFRLAVYAKLSTLMGVTWIFEVLSWAIGGDPKVWFLLDAANLLRAVFIFIIFCCNKHVYQQLKFRVQTFFSRRSSRANTGTLRSSGASGSTVLQKGSGSRKKSSKLLLDSAQGAGGKLEESKKPSKSNLKDFVRPSCQNVLGSAQQPQLKDTQL